jgi:hypothetical protein
MKQRWIDPLTATVLSPILFGVGWFWIAGAFVASAESWWTLPIFPFAVEAAAMWCAFRALFVTRFLLVPMAGFGLLLAGSVMFLWLAH